MKRILLRSAAFRKIFRRIVLVIFVLLTTSYLRSQVFNGNLTLATQAEVDAFNYTSVTGFLTIGSTSFNTSSDITNLNGLSELTSVGSSGGIWILNNPLTNLNGLSNLQSTGLLIIEQNPFLINLNGLSGLLSVGSKLDIFENPLLTSIDLPNLSSIGAFDPLGVGSFLRIVENNTLNSINLTSNLVLTGNLIVSLNPLLTDISATAIASISGSLSFFDNLLLADIDFSGLLSIGEDLNISRNPSLTNIDLSGLLSIGRDLNISTNPSLTNIDASNLTSVRDFSIGINGALTELNGFSSLATARSILISNNEALANIDGLSNLTSTQSIIITFNTVLENVDGLSGITALDGLHLRDNPALTNVDGLSNLVSISGFENPAILTLQITVNLSLTNLNGLSNLASVEGNLRISSNLLLSEFCGLYTLLNGNGLTGTYTVTGNAVNPTIQQIIDGGECDLPPQCPVAANLNTTVATGGSVSLQLQSTNPNAATLQYQITQAPAHGVVVVQTQTGAATYTPHAGYCGTDIFKFKVNNGICLSNEATVIINVICNSCPVANPLDLSASRNSPINFQLIATDADVDVLQYSITQAPSHGFVVLNGQTGAGTYMALAGYSGTDQFKYKVSDGVCENEATVNITIVICPEGQGYWKNNPESWPVNATPMLLGTQSYNKAQLLVILNTSPGIGNKSDASLILAHQLIAAKLNIANGTATPPPVPDSIVAADLTIGNNRIPMNVRPNSPLGKRMVNNAGFLDTYNNGFLTAACRPETEVLTASKNQNVLAESSSILESAMEINAYPNPSTNIFTINVNAKTNEGITMQVVDMYGRVIETRNVNANSPIRFGDRYNSGTYFVRILQGKEHKEIKLIKLSD